jgi:hypothetical protein
VNAFSMKSGCEVKSLLQIINDYFSCGVFCLTSGFGIQKPYMQLPCVCAKCIIYICNGDSLRSVQRSMYNRAFQTEVIIISNVDASKTPQ